MKKILAVFLMALLTFITAACGDTPPECTSHADTDGDGKCDVCGTAVEDEKPEEKPSDDELTLIADGKANFQLVIAKSALTVDVKKAVDDIVKKLGKLDIDVKAVTESADNKQAVEVIIGVPSERGEGFEYDIHTLGAEGYAIKITNDNVQVLGGSEEALIGAIETFTEEFLGITSKTKELTAVTVKKSQSIEEIQDDYRISSLSVDGEDMRSYTLAVDLKDKTSNTVAKLLQSAFYLRAGYWLPIVSLEEADKSVVVKINENTYKGNGFFIDVKDGQLVFECEFPNKLEEAMSDFIAKKITLAQGDLNFTSKAYKSSVNVRDIYYEDFGVNTNGTTDAFEAIKACHEYANEWGHTVKAKSSSTFYIGSGHGSDTIHIKTDVDWGGCKFIIDDYEITSDSVERQTQIFSIVPDGARYTEVADRFSAVTTDNPLSGEDGKESTNIGWAPGEACMLLIRSSERKIYIRYGSNANDGSDLQEIILVDAEGNIDESTPLMWTYTRIDEAFMYPVETVRPITVGNAKVDKISNCAPADYKYYNRGIAIRRSRTTLKNITYNHIDEGTIGDPYTGFVAAEYCSDILIKNYTYNSPICYRDAVNGVEMGTYSLNSKAVNNIVHDGLNQTNYQRVEGEGTKIISAHGSNFCKNMYVVNSRIAYFDAHQGTYNATFKDSEIAHVNLIGEGVIRFENVKYTGTDSPKTYYGYGIGLRQDYGATWKGSVELVNVQLVMEVKDVTSLFRSGGVTLNHDFGYTCHFPSRVYIDGLEIVDYYGDRVTGKTLYFASFLDRFNYGDISIPESQGGAGESNPYMPCTELIIKNYDGTGNKFLISKNPFFANNLKLYVDEDGDGEAEEIHNWTAKYGY